MAEDLLGALVALVAVATLPLGILAALFVGLQTAAVVFVVGWLLLVPVLAIAGDAFAPAVANALGTGEEAAAEAEADPLERLRERYATGELTEAEFERKVERLLETEDVAVDTGERAPDRAAEPDRERERDTGDGRR